VGEATAALGRCVAPHIRRQSSKLLPASLTQPTDAGGCSKFDDACDIAASGLKGLLLSCLHINSLRFQNSAVVSFSV